MNWIKENIFGLSLLAPTIIILFAVSIFPMIYTVWISLYDFYLPRPNSKAFIGLGNYIEIFVFWGAFLDYFLENRSRVNSENVVNPLVFMGRNGGRAVPGEPVPGLIF